MSEPSRTYFLDLLLNALCRLSTRVHPAWSFPVAALVFCLSALGLERLLPGSQPWILAYALAGFPATAILGAGAICARFRQEQQDDFLNEARQSSGTVLFGRNHGESRVCSVHHHPPSVPPGRHCRNYLQHLSDGSDSTARGQVGLPLPRLNRNYRN